MPENYNDTLNLPKTPFSMRAGLPTKEPEMLKDWEENDLYRQMVDNNDGKPVYILHDGPPYANAAIHLGTAMNKILKDIIVRQKNMAGFKAPYVPGWDTHGLPIERKALESLGDKRKEVSDYELRRICNDFALRYVDVQREQFIRLGSLGEYSDPYLTLSHDFEAHQIEVFGQMADKGYIYKGLKPVYWCATDRTALAEAEIEYENDHVDSIYVAFQVAKDNGALEKAGIEPDKAWFVIWTTTTWTLPGNVAICLGPKFTYVAAKVGERYYIVAEELLKNAMEECGIEEYEVVAKFKGEELERIEAKHCYLDRRSLIIMGDHVTLESGTGCVHTAPGHGEEDYEVVTRNYPELPMIVPVDDDGNLTEEAGQFAGLQVFKASPVIQEYLKETGHLVGLKHLEHQYPHCWRCHSPIIYRATDQWFCSVDAFKEDTYKAVEEVQWIPAWGKDRMMGMVRDRADWCISRQRLWGVPIPAFYCDDCGKYMITPQSVTAVKELFAVEGSDAWYTHEASEILPKDTKCPHCGGTHFTKEKDTMDVWFDSGTSHASVLTERKDHTWPADLYLEGSDQFRGWFQSSLLTAVATKGAAPYKTVVSCGWTVDGEGRKMSKSLGNGIEPEEIIKDYGADIIRLWVAAGDYQQDMRISKDILKQLSESYRKVRNTARFILGNISDFNPDTDMAPDGDLQELDSWALAEFSDLAALCRDAYDAFDFHKVYHNLHRFCVISMSNFYLDVIKDRLYITPAAGKARRAAQTVMFKILVGLTQIIAPILAFTSQEIWDHVPQFEGKKKYIAMHEMPKGGDFALAPEEKEKWNKIIAITQDVKKVLETARAEKQIGSSLEAKVVLHCNAEWFAFLQPQAAALADIFIVSQVEVHEGAGGTAGEVEGVNVAVAAADGEKCERCWQYKTTVGQSSLHPTLCGRCAGIIEDA